MRRILSAELFMELAGLPQSSARGVGDCPKICHDRWTDLAKTLAAMPQALEMFILIGSRRAGSPDRAIVSACFLAAGRGKTRAHAQEECLREIRRLWTLLGTNLDYAELEPIEDAAELGSIIDHLFRPEVIEFRRRFERVRVNHGSVERAPIGFEAVHPHQQKTIAEEDARLDQLFPWVPSDDSWRRLVETLAAEEGPAALICHVRGHLTAPEKCLAAAHRDLAEAEKIVDLIVERSVETVMKLEAETLRQQSLQRLAILLGRVVAARIFVSCEKPPSSVLLGTIESCLDDASVEPSQTGANLLFRGGARLSRCPHTEILAPLDNPTIDVLFSPNESSAFLRTPMPSETELPGIQINRARTASITGHSGDDVLLGYNVHRGQRLSAALDEAVRFRHTYIIGQTGTGKSTLLLHLILQDIKKGRGVAVLDPHGSLIEQILLHYPQDRRNDIVVVDTTDVDRPVGFNPLVINESDPLQYRLARDLVVDDLYSYLRAAYSELPEAFGPMFESHFRGMLSMLLGMESPKLPLIPNLLIFRLLYTNAGLRERLASRVRGKDLIADDFLKEALEAGGEASLANMAQYVTSKFTRFVADMSLRNITCQNRILDLEDIIKTGKVLLFFLGRGRFGDQAAGLLASQIVSHIRRLVMRRGASEKAQPFYLYADEFQLFADDRFAELMAEARKFRLCLTIAHQYVRQLPEKVLQGVLGNVGTTVVFRVGAPDGEFLEGVFSPSFRKRDLTSLPNFRAYVRSFGALGQTPFSMELQSPPGEGSAESAASLRELSRLTYGRDRVEVEEEIAGTYKAYSGHNQDLEAEA